MSKNIGDQNAQSNRAYPPSKKIRSKKPANRIAPVNIPVWFPICGVIFGGLTLIFFMALVVAEILGVEVKLDSRFILTIVLAMGAGLSVSFLGGTAVAKGKISLPYFKDSPISFAVTGGVAIPIIIFLLGYFTYANQDVYPPNEKFLKVQSLPFVAEVIYNGSDGVNIRKEPLRTSNVIAAILKDSRLKITNGPIDADKNRWWYAEFDHYWVSESTAEKIPQLKPIDTDKIQPGSKVKIVSQYCNPVELKLFPNPDSDSVFRFLSNSQLEIIEGPQKDANGTNWWKVKIPPGWIAEGGLHLPSERMLRIIPQ
jgi:hypothetical protein